MKALKEQKCEACRVGAPQVSEEEIIRLKSQIPDWNVKQIDGVKKLQKTYTFKNYVEALQFTNEVGKIAEKENHHPSILTEWGKVTVTWWTHKINGLHINDFIMASKTDELLVSHPH